MRVEYAHTRVKPLLCLLVHLVVFPVFLLCYAMFSAFLYEFNLTSVLVNDCRYSHLIKLLVIYTNWAETFGDSYHHHVWSDQVTHCRNKLIYRFERSVLAYFEIIRKPDFWIPVLLFFHNHLGYTYL